MCDIALKPVDGILADTEAVTAGPTDVDTVSTGAGLAGGVETRVNVLLEEPVSVVAC